MSFERPTLSELVDRIQADFVSRLQLSGAVLRRSVVYVLARVVAGAAHMLHGHLDFLARQLFPDQSEAEFLERQGSLFGVNRNPPEFADGDVIIWGTDGTVIPDASVLVRSDQVEYSTNDEVEIATLTAWAALTAYTVGQLRQNGGEIYQVITAGTSAVSGGPTGEGSDITDGTVHWMHVGTGTAAVIVTVTASVAAADGNADPGVILSFESPVAGANADALVGFDGLSGGTDEENDDDYRVRVLERMSDPPQGGSESDYIAWAKGVPGVTRVWVYPAELGAGTVTVRFVRDDDADLIPDAGEVADVQAYIDERRPVTADVTVVAPVDDPVNFDFASITPDNSAVRAAITAELEDFFARVPEPASGVLLSQLRTAIGLAAGLEDYVLTTPAADIVQTTGELATLGTVTFP